METLHVRPLQAKNMEILRQFCGDMEILSEEARKPRPAFSRQETLSVQAAAERSRSFRYSKRPIIWPKLRTKQEEQNGGRLLANHSLLEIAYEKQPTIKLFLC
jgi:hypothetical protein